MSVGFRQAVAATAGVLGAIALGLAAAPAIAADAPAAASDWRPLDPENTLVIDTTQGRVVVELVPEVAPNHVARIKALTRSSFYNGLNFHRVIDDFMAQTGNPGGSGGSSLPNLMAELTFRRGPDTPFTLVSHWGGGDAGFVRSLPVFTQKEALMAITASGTVSGWGFFCPGVAGMAKGDDPDSANSQFFLMRQANPALQQNYTAWGRAVVGLDVIRAIKTGEPPKDPDKMVKVRMMVDMPEAEQPKVLVMNTQGPAFRALVDRANKAANGLANPCEIDLPVKPN